MFEDSFGCNYRKETFLYELLNNFLNLFIKTLICHILSVLIHKSCYDDDDDDVEGITMF